MPAAIMVLGPSRWARKDPQRAVADTPLEVRRYLAGLLIELGSPAVVLEDEEQTAEEDNFAFLQRTIEQREVRSFLVFWPLSARLHGLEVELGYLLTRLEEGSLDPDDVYLVVEKRAFGIDRPEGVVAWSEPGNRTRYHEDLVARGCRVRRWSSMEGLRRQLGAIALDHRVRYPG